MIQNSPIKHEEKRGVIIDEAEKWMAIKAGYTGGSVDKFISMFVFKCHNESDKERKKKREREEVKDADMEKQR